MKFNDGCSVCGEKPLRCRGFCNRHYIAWRRYGDPLGAKFEHSKNMVGSYEYLVENIKVIPGPLDTDCWVWQKARTDAGYGVFGSEDRVTTYSHRRMFELVVDSSIEDWIICHECDNPPCCNPDHLFKGTTLDNNNDMIKKGRAKKFRLITPQEAEEIRKRANSGEPIYIIAKDFTKVGYAAVLSTARGVNNSEDSSFAGM